MTEQGPLDTARPSSPDAAAAAADVAYAQPRPRPPKSPAHSAQIRVRNRRREYLERHPEYFDTLEHELAGKSDTKPLPLLLATLRRKHSFGKALQNSVSADRR